MNKRRGVTSEELLELQVESSGYVEAQELINRIKTEGARSDQIVLWLDEVDCFNEIFYPLDPIHDHDRLVIAKYLWRELLAAVINDKGTLIYCAQTIVNSMLGYGIILDVSYSEVAQRLIWKVKFNVDKYKEDDL